MGFVHMANDREQGVAVAVAQPSDRPRLPCSDIGGSGGLRANVGHLRRMARHDSHKGILILADRPCLPASGNGPSRGSLLIVKQSHPVDVDPMHDFRRLGGGNMRARIDFPSSFVEDERRVPAIRPLRLKTSRWTNW